MDRPLVHIAFAVWILVMLAAIGFGVTQGWLTVFTSAGVVGIPALAAWQATHPSSPSKVSDPSHE